MLAGESENIEHVGFGNFLAAEADQLIEHRFGIAQSAFGPAGDGVRGRGRECDFLLSGDELEMLRNQVRGDAVQVEALAAAQDCRQNFLRLGRGENEFHVRRRLFQRLEQCVERGGRKHVHFVDQIDFVATFCRGVANVIAQLAHVLNAVVAGSVDLDHVEAVAGGDLAAVIAHAAGRDGGAVHAIERLCQNACGRGFANATRADKKVGVGEPVLLDRILERAGDVRLTDDVIKSLRPIFSRENFVVHVRNLTRHHVNQN